MRFSFKALLVLATLFCFGLEEFGVQEAQAGTLVRRPRSRFVRFRRQLKASTYIAKRDQQPGKRGDEYGDKKSISKVYASRFKQYKLELRYWQREKKLAEKLEKQYSKMQEKRAIQEAKARVEIARRLAKQKQKERMLLANQEQVQADAESEDKEKATKSKSLFSKLSNKADTANGKYIKGKTGFRKDKLKFMSRVFLTLFGKE